MSGNQPHILFIQADQLNPQVLPAHGDPAVTPHLDRLCEEGVVFENACCNFPLCAPSRFSMLAGMLPSRIRAFDNGAELPASTPTMAHYLRLAGYHTSLSGKQHFVGPDMLHGFHERLVPEFYPTDFHGPVEDPTLRARVGRRILEMVTGGHYLPGEKLVETALADQLQVSRAPLREAIRELADQGSLINRPYRDLRVRPVSAKDLEELHSLRTAREQFAFRLAWPGRSTKALPDYVRTSCCSPDTHTRAGSRRPPWRLAALSGHPVAASRFARRGPRR